MTGPSGPAGQAGAVGPAGPPGRDGQLRVYGDGSAGPLTISNITDWTVNAQAVNNYWLRRSHSFVVPLK
jgi:hypothetical protein